MKELIEYIAKAIVDKPEAVVITEETNEKGLVFKLQVADEDKGRVIGKQGRIVQAMRTLLRVTAAKLNTKERLELISLFSHSLTHQPPELSHKLIELCAF